MLTAVGIDIVLADDSGVCTTVAARLRNNLVTASGQIETADVALGQDNAQRLPDFAHRDPHRFSALTIDVDADFRPLAPGSEGGLNAKLCNPGC